MSTLTKLLASTKLTFQALMLLGLLLLAGQFTAALPRWSITAALALLATNLAAALMMQAKLRKSIGLFTFHVALLAILILAGIGRLTHLDARVELLEGSGFHPNEIEVDNAGPLHPDWLKRVSFTQGAYSIDYAPGVKRAHTRNQIVIETAAGAMTQQIGDDIPFVANGYRFYTTHNKGFAPVLTWTPDRGDAITGAVHMPSFPLFEWKQDNRWQPPNGPEIKLWLHLDTPLREDAAWTLQSDKIAGSLAINAGGKRVELRRGEVVRLAGGSLRFDELRGWMGYRIFFDPTLPWLFAAATLAVAGLGVHFWRRNTPVPYKLAPGFSAPPTIAKEAS